MPSNRDDVRLLACSWALVTVGAIVLMLGYRHIPDEVVLYRPPGAEVPLTAPKSPFSVGRLALMGVGQLGAATAMVLATRSAAAWQRFWLGVALVAGAKTLLECASLLAAPGGVLARILTILTFAAVAVFVLVAVRWWRRGGLGPHPAVGKAPRLVLIAALALWAACAFAPLVSAA